MNIFSRRSLRFGLALFALAALTSTAGAVSPDIVIHQVSGVPTGCDVPATVEISQVQGSGSATPLAGQTVRVEGVVTGDFQGTGGLGGFFIQDDTPDADPATSEGLFVVTTTLPAAVGDRVRVTGTATEFNGLTEIFTVTAVDVCSTANPLPAAVTYDLPRAAGVTFEPVEGMLVTFPEALTASEHFQLGRFGEVTVSSDGRLLEPTTVADPGAPAVALQELNDRRRLLIDDGLNVQNPDTVPFLTPNVLRLGDTASGITGVMSFGFSQYRLQPTAPITFTRTNPRPAAPSAVGGEIRVASLNTLNYFTTLTSDNSSARGATTAEEFSRQQAKLVSAITGLNADVIGLIEIENNGATAIESLVDALNTATAAGTYSYITEPVLNAPNAFGGTFGADAIKVAIIYRPASVTPEGAAQSSADAVFDRPPLIQTFQPVDSSELFTVAVNHFKSKNCGGATGLDADQGDGQSCFNDRRDQQASALATLLDTLDVPKALVIGDLNSNTEEDPIHTLETAGFTELSSLVAAGERYSFIFNAQSGELDHALAAADLADNVTGAAIWHINADEPLFLDYNTEFKPPALLALYQPDAYRSSDHDPIVVGLSFAPTQLIVVKHVVKDNGGDADAADFTMSVTATNPSTASFPGDEAGTTITVEPGSYSVGETGPSGYAASFSADCSGTIALHETKTCTVTNDDITPTLTVNKVVDPAADTGTFNLQIDGSTAGTGAAVGDGGTTGAVPVNAGSHTVGETAAGSTILSDYDVAISGDCAPDGSISLSLAQNASCTITNTRKAAPPVSQITASGLCQQFSAGTAPDLPTLGSGGQLEYSLKKDKVSQTNPGTFFYWVKVDVGAGARSAVVDQSILTANFTRTFSLGSGSQPVYNAGCASVRGATATQAANGDVTVNWTAAAGGTFYIGLKYSTSSIVGGAKPDPGTNVDYTFETTGIAGSTEGVRLSKKK
jgi:uncharacterized protein